MPALTDLPIELIDQILDEIEPSCPCDYYPKPWSPSLLLPLSNTCHSLKRLLEPRIFRTFRYRRLRPSVLFLTIRTFLARPELALHVEDFSNIRREPEAENAGLDWVSMNSVELKNLGDLAQRAGIASEALRFYSPALNSIVGLTANPPLLWSPTIEQCVLLLLTMLPNLHELSLHYDIPSLDDHTIGPTVTRGDIPHHLSLRAIFPHFAASCAAAQITTRRPTQQNVDLSSPSDSCVLSWGSPLIVSQLEPISPVTRESQWRTYRPAWNYKPKFAIPTPCAYDATLLAARILSLRPLPVVAAIFGLCSSSNTMSTRWHGFLRYFDIAALARLLRPCARSLVRLTLQIPPFMAVMRITPADWDLDFTVRLDIADFAQLRYLSAPIRAILGPEPETAPTLREALPPGLVRLTLFNDVCTWTESAVVPVLLAFVTAEGVGVEHGGPLKWLNWHMDDQRWEWRSDAQLEAACKSAGVRWDLLLDGLSWAFMHVGTTS
ncbi:hypothetical protein EDC01DRAFT_509088 [Geopyxis carbonaria]|nr:hypothetical protein EDC01DRAFT_509088 [Geopyxis carbonaria]